LHSEPCQNLSPELEDAAVFLKEKGITLINVDCTVGSGLCSDYSVTSYPTIRIFRGPGNFTRYRGKRKAKSYAFLEVLPTHPTADLQSSIISYMIRQALPIVSAVNSSNFEEIVSLDIAALIAYIGENDRKSSEVFTSISDLYRNQFIFGITPDLALAKADVAELL
jgi:protein disulfide-isomerase A1